jgi:uncharacterized membrane protein
MLRYAIAYVSSAAVFLAVDFVWLSFASPNFYRPRLGNLLSANPNLRIAAVFYMAYVVGIVILAVMPGFAARSWPMAIGLGAVLGFVAYGTYDLTNLSTIQGWSAAVSAVDLAWGTFATALAAGVGYGGLWLFART